MSEVLDWWWLNQIAPYCGRPLYDTTCPKRPHHSCQCDAKPDHERGQVEHHICQCGRAWTTEPFEWA